MDKYKNLSVPPQLHKRVKLLSAHLDIRIIDVVERALDLLEAQNELPHPIDAQVVPLAYQQKQSK